MSRHRETETVTLDLPGDVVDEYRRIAGTEKLSEAEVVSWCLGRGYLDYAEGDGKPSAFGTKYSLIRKPEGGNGSA